MIDKKIFYCWFGDNEMSDLDKRCMETWAKFCPDYEIIKISEDNYNWELNPYAKIGYEAGNWSAVSNAARLEFLEHNNGFYLDTDVQLFKSLDELRVFDGGFITEFESGQPDSGILGRGENFPKFYKEVYSRLLPGTVLHKEFIQVLFRDYDVKGETQRTFDDGFTILGEEFFPTVRTGLFTENTIGIHHFENTWINNRVPIYDGFYPFPKLKVYVGNKMIHEDDAPMATFKVKNLKKKWTDPDMLGKTDYFFNPRVVKLSNRDFEAERINYDKFAPQHHTVTVSGMIVTWI